MFEVVGRDVTLQSEEKQEIVQLASLGSGTLTVGANRSS